MTTTTAVVSFLAENFIDGKKKDWKIADQKSFGRKCFCLKNKLAENFLDILFDQKHFQIDRMDGLKIVSVTNTKKKVWANAPAQH